MVQCTNKTACGHFFKEHNSKDCLDNLSQNYISCKKNYKAWDNIYPYKKVEIERIIKALAETPYGYLTNRKK